MAANEDGDGVRPRRGLWALGVGLLLVLAATLPDGWPWDEGNAAERVVIPDPPELLSYVLLIAAVLLALYVVTVAEWRHLAPKRRRSSGTLRALAILLLLAALWVLLPQITRTFEAFTDRREPTQKIGVEGPEGSPAIDRSPALGYAVTALVVLALAALGGAALWVLRPQTAPVDGNDDELLAGVRRGITDLESISDPRAAVIACYAHLQVVVSAHGVDHRVSDVPLQLLEKIEDQRPSARSSAQSLTELFEEAKFSTRPIGETARADALRALGRLKRSLESYS